MDYVVSLVILLGVLVAIHEFGHFIVAKAFGMRVETFSIGMGKKILSYTRGETEYALSLIPLGGYVKITGQDPREEVPPEIEHRSFRNKPLYQRTAVVLAGPIFNAVLAAFVLIGLYAYGVPVPSAQIARVLKDSPAEKSGFKAGDVVTEVRSASEVFPIQEYSDLEKVVGESAGRSLVFTVQRSERGAAASQSVQIEASPEMGLDRDSTLGVLTERGVLAGVERNAPGPVVVPLAGSWAARKLVPFGFWVSEVTWMQNGVLKSEKPENYADLANTWQNAVRDQPRNGAITLVGHKVLVENDPKAAGAKSAEAPSDEQRFTLDWISPADRPVERLTAAGLASSELFIIDVKADSPAHKLGLQKGDEIKRINGQEILSFSSFRESIQKLAVTGQALRIEWRRGTQDMSAEIKPQVVSTTDPLTEAKKEQFQIGTAFLAVQAPTALKVLKAGSAGEAIRLGFNKTVLLTGTMLKSFYLLAKGDISPKTLGGPILIGKIAGESFRQGWVAFFRTMAFISLNLFILNLFPIPVLDGGHLVLFAVEAIRRKPLSIRIIEVWTTAGFFLLMSLVAVVFFNDLSRLGLFRFLNL